MKKTILVTGDSRGLGADIIELLLHDEQYGVIGLSRSGSDRIDGFQSRYPQRFHHVDFDLANPKRVRELYRDGLKPRGPIYGLVNNAAVAYDDLVTNADSDRVRKMFDVNVAAPIMLSKFVIRDMLLHRTEGSLVHVSSISTSTGYKGLSMYGASKGAIEAFSLGMAREWGERGIRSNCVAAGFMNTEMTSSLSAQQKERIYARTSLKEPTDPVSVASTIKFLLSPDAHSVTGEVLRVDAGSL
jgi:3-oxoacyl-[acyl-carrier protein] reductase